MNNEKKKKIGAYRFSPQLEDVIADISRFTLMMKAPLENDDWFKKWRSYRLLVYYEVLINNRTLFSSEN